MPASSSDCAENATSALPASSLRVSRSAASAKVRAAPKEVRNAASCAMTASSHAIIVDATAASMRISVPVVEYRVVKRLQPPEPVSAPSAPNAAVSVLSAAGGAPSRSATSHRVSARGDAGVVGSGVRAGSGEATPPAQAVVASATSSARAPTRRIRPLVMSTSQTSGPARGPHRRACVRVLLPG